MAAIPQRQFLFSYNPLLSYVQGQVVIGATGAVSSYNGSGIASVVRLAQGVYQINLLNNFYRFLDFTAGFQSPPTGNTAVTAITPGLVYTIRTVGSTTQAQWETAGVPKGVPAAVGLPFLAAATSSGSGTASTPAFSGIDSVEVVGNPQDSINYAPTSAAYPYIVVQCVGPTASGDTTPLAVDPVSGSTMNFEIMCRASSLPGLNE